jgi:hypothetical protein
VGIDDEIIEWGCFFALNKNEWIIKFPLNEDGYGICLVENDMVASL